METFTRLKEKTELLRRHVLSLEQETNSALAMRDGSMAPSVKGAPFDVLWRALPRVDKSVENCPRCQLSLHPFPRATNALLMCTSCGFVAKQLEARRERPTISR
jgi:hypothetical protein